MGYHHQYTRTPPSGKHISGRAGLRTAVLRGVKKRVECRLIDSLARKRQISGFLSTTPLRAPHCSHFNSPLSERFTDTPSLRSPHFVQISLGRAIANLKAIGIPKTRCTGVTQQHHHARLQARPDGIGECREHSGCQQATRQKRLQHGSWTKQSLCSQGDPVICSQISLRLMNHGVNGALYRENTGSPTHSSPAPFMANCSFVRCSL